MRSSSAAIPGVPISSSRAAKRLANLAAEADAPAILAAESAEQALLMRSPNQIEAVMSQMEKRTGQFVDP